MDAERPTDLEIARMKRDGRARIMRDVRRLLDAPLPQPKDPRKSRVLWAIVWYAIGAVSVVVFLVAPGAIW